MTTAFVVIFFTGTVLPVLFTVKINKNKDFLTLYSKGFVVSDNNVIVYFRKNKLPVNRLGISTSKKVGNAVMRSRARRVIRQAYRECELSMPVGFDIIVCARTGAAQCKSYHITAFMRKRLIPKMSDPAALKPRAPKKRS